MVSNTTFEASRSFSFFSLSQIHLPALALHSSWPSFLSDLFSFELERNDVVNARWTTLLATIICVVLNLGLLGIGADRRRGFMPLMLGIVGSGFVVVAPLYFLAGDYK